MYSSGSGSNLAAVRCSLGDEVLVASVQCNALAIDNQRVTSLHNDHVLVVIMDVGSRWRGLTTSPKCHLDTVSPVENVSLDSGVAWSVVAILFDGCFMNSGNLSMAVHCRRCRANQYGERRDPLTTT